MFRFIGSVFLALLFVSSVFADVPEEALTAQEIWRRSNDAFAEARSFSFAGTTEVRVVIDSGSSTGERPPFAASGNFSGRIVKQEGHPVPDMAMDGSSSISFAPLGPNPLPIDFHYRVVGGMCYTQIGFSRMPAQWETADCARLSMPSAEEVARIGEQDECGLKNLSFFAYEETTVETVDGVRMYSLPYRFDKTKLEAALASVACVFASQTPASETGEVDESREGFRELLKRILPVIEMNGVARVNAADFLPYQSSAVITIRDFKPFKTGASEDMVVINGTVGTIISWGDYGTAAPVTPPDMSPPDPASFFKSLCDQIPAGEERPPECAPKKQ